MTSLGNGETTARFASLSLSIFPTSGQLQVVLLSPIKFRPFMQRLNSLPPLRPFQRLGKFRPFPISYANMSAPSAARTDGEAETVANTSGITAESLQKTLTEKLEAKHVDIEDMSGNNDSPREPRGLLVLTTIRRLRPDVSSHDRFTPVREEEQSRTTSTRQFSLED